MTDWTRWALSIYRHTQILLCKHLSRLSSAQSLFHPPDTLRLDGETAIVTGSNSGIGLSTIPVLLDHGISHVIIAVRSIEKGEKAAESLRQQYPEATIDVWALDMLSYESIQQFAKRCSTLPRVDKVILNAGVAMNDFVINTCTGHEETLQVNYLSTALLALLLVPIVKQNHSTGLPGKITMVTSGLALSCKFANRDADPLIPSFDDRTGWSTAAAFERYGVSKLLLLFFIQKLSGLVSGDDVVLNAVEPGLVGGSGLFRHAEGLVSLAGQAVNRMASRTLQQGAWAYADALCVQGRESHGGLVMNWKVVGFRSVVYGDSGKLISNRLFQETLVELDFAGAKGIIKNL